MERADVPEGFIRLSDAAHRLERGVWGCQLAKPVPLQAIKPSDLRGGTVAFNLRNLRARKRKLGSLMAWGEEKDGILVIRPKDRKAGSLGFGPWKEEAGKLLRAAAIQGQLGIYVSPDNEAAIKKYGREPLRLPCDVLQRMIPQRGSLPDHPIRCSLKLAGGDSKVFDLLRTGVLLVHTKEFDSWYRSERAKGRWPSQRSKRRTGRPSKQTDGLAIAVESLMREQQTSIPKLRRRLIALGRNDVPSLDTLGRLVDRRYRETGEPALRRTRRLRRKPG